MAHQLDKGNGYFGTAIRETVDETDPLPLVHNTDCYVLRQIILDDKIDPQGCPVYGEQLTYLFYGRPSYRPNIGEAATTQKHFMPVCFIFKRSASINIKRAFPFDTGAFQRAFYKSFLHDKMVLGDFALDSDYSSPGKVVSYFFGSNENYMTGQPRNDLSPDVSEFEVGAYTDLLSSRGSNAFDSRSTSIEIQTDETIDFSDSVDAVILPSSFVKSAIGAALAKAGIEILPYRVADRFMPTEWTGEIHSLCMDYFIRKSYIQTDAV